jgi:hypothetical protein
MKLSYWVLGAAVLFWFADSQVDAGGQTKIDNATIGDLLQSLNQIDHLTPFPLHYGIAATGIYLFYKGQ